MKPLLYGKYYLVDTNECYGTAHGCQHNCINTHGSYHCTCISGYTLSSNLKSCLGVYDIKKKDLIGMHWSQIAHVKYHNKKLNNLKMLMLVYNK